MKQNVDRTADQLGLVSSAVGLKATLRSEYDILSAKFMAGTGRGYPLVLKAAPLS